MNINLTIKSFDINKDEILEKVNAKKESGNNRIQYTYSNEYGETVLKILNGNLKMIRTGETFVELYFFENGKGKFLMEAYGLKSYLEVKEGKVEYLEKNKILISYKLYNGEELINDLAINLEEY